MLLLLICIDCAADTVLSVISIPRDSCTILQTRIYAGR